VLDLSRAASRLNYTPLGTRRGQLWFRGGTGILPVLLLLPPATNVAAGSLPGSGRGSRRDTAQTKHTGKSAGATPKNYNQLQVFHADFGASESIQLIVYRPLRSRKNTDEICARLSICADRREPGSLLPGGRRWHRHSCRCSCSCLPTAVVSRIPSKQADVLPAQSSALAPGREGDLPHVAARRFASGIQRRRQEGFSYSRNKAHRQECRCHRRMG